LVVLAVLVRQERRIHKALFPDGLDCVVCHKPIHHDGRNHRWLHPDGQE
jgi:hypothetical protein